MKTHSRSFRKKKALLVGLAAGIVAAGTAFFFFADSLPGVNAKSGKLEIETTPPGATIFIDGKKQGDKTNTEVSAEAGERTLKLELDKYDSQEIKVIVLEDQTVPVEHVFTVGGKAVTEVGPQGPQANELRDDQLETYTNEKYGYSVRFPKGWLAETDPEGVAHFFNAEAAKTRADSPGAEVEESFAILAQPNPNNLAPKAWYQAREEFAVEDQNQIKQRDLAVNGRPAYQWDTPYGFVPYTNTVITGKGQAFILQIKQNTPERQIYDQILQTFTLL